MSEASIYFFSGCLMFLFLLLGGLIGGLIGFIINMWLTNNSETEEEYAGYHPEFFDQHGNFINEELISLRIIDEDEEDED